MGLIREVGDLERLLSKAAVGRVNPREVSQIRRALAAIGELKSYFAGGQTASLLQLIASGLDPCPELAEKIDRTLTSRSSGCG